MEAEPGLESHELRDLIERARPVARVPPQLEQCRGVRGFELQAPEPLALRAVLRPESRNQMPLGIEISSNVKTTRGNMINVNSHRDNIQPG